MLVNRWLLCVMLGIINVPAKAYLVENGINAVCFLIADLKAVFECCIFAVNVDIVGKISRNCFARKRKTEQLQSINQSCLAGAVLPI